LKMGKAKKADKKLSTKELKAIFYNLQRNHYEWKTSYK